MASGLLVPQPGIKPTLPAVEAPGPNRWTGREVPCYNTLNVNRLHLSQVSDSKPWEREKQTEGRREWGSGLWNRWTPSHSRRSPCLGGRRGVGQRGALTTPAGEAVKLLGLMTISLKLCLQVDTQLLYNQEAPTNLVLF